MMHIKELTYKLAHLPPCNADGLFTPSLSIADLSAALVSGKLVTLVTHQRLQFSGYVQAIALEDGSRRNFNVTLYYGGVTRSVFLKYPASK